MIEKVLFFIALIVITACQNPPPRAETGTYLGGEIVNPTSNTIVIKENGTVIDSIRLDQNNRFLFKFPKIEAGLYSFTHNEGQILYLEPGDSLLLRVNTFEFDETLTFSGYGAPENNLLMRFYLINEKENFSMIKQEVYQEGPEAFTKSILRFKEERQAKLDAFLKKNTVSPYFKKIAQAIVDYDFYARKEVYPMSHFGVDRVKFIKSLPASFYDYRARADLNDQDLLGLFSYQRFLINYFNQAAFKEYYMQEAYDPLSFTHNLHKLRLIHTQVKNDSVQSFLLTRTIKDYLANSNDKKGGETLYDMYMQHISSNADKQEIRNLYTANQKIETGKRIPNEKFISFEKDTVSFRSVIKQPTFIFFWSNENKSHAKQAQRLANSYLEKFPEFTFMAINVKDNFDTWQRTVNRYDFDRDKQYLYVGGFSKLVEDLALSSTLKTLIVDKNGFIINAHTNIFSSNFEHELLKALN